MPTLELSVEELDLAARSGRYLAGMLRAEFANQIGSRLSAGQEKTVTQLERLTTKLEGARLGARNSVARLAAEAIEEDRNQTRVAQPSCRRISARSSKLRNRAA